MKLYSFDSFDKIKYYFLMLSKEPIDGMAPPKYFGVSWTFWRDYSCPPICGGCCWNYTKDIFEEEFVNFPDELKVKFAERDVVVNNKSMKIYSDFNPKEEKRKREFCQFLNLNDGLCGMYKYRPFSCRFELNKLSFNKKYLFEIISK